MPQNDLDMPRRAPEAARRWLAWSLVLLALVVVVLFVRWLSEAQRRQEIAALQPQDRQVVFQHTLLSFRDLCIDRPLDSSLESYCVHQQAFLEDFPECAGECHALLRRFSPRGATR